MKLDWLENCLTWFVLISVAAFAVLLISYLIMPPTNNLSLWQEIQGGSDWQGMSKTIKDMTQAE